MLYSNSKLPWATPLDGRISAPVLGENPVLGTMSYDSSSVKPAYQNLGMKYPNRVWVMIEGPDNLISVLAGILPHNRFRSLQ